MIKWDDKTIEALKGSIEKWRRIREEDGIDNGSRDCPLCDIYWKEVDLENDENIEVRCFFCPVYESTGQHACEGSPYKKWRSYLKEAVTKGIISYMVYDEVSEELALDMEEFLKGLMP
jgi:hypothetical protein